MADPDDTIAATRRSNIVPLLLVGQLLRLANRVLILPGHQRGCRRNGRAGRGREPSHRQTQFDGPRCLTPPAQNIVSTVTSPDVSVRQNTPWTRSSSN